MSDGTDTQGNTPTDSTQSNNGAGQNGQDNHGNQSGNSAGNNSAGAAHAPTPAVDFAPIMTALAALPEQMAKAVKEAVGTPAKPPTEVKPPTETGSNGGNSGEGSTGKQTSGSGTSGKQGAPSGEPGKRKGLADWWFGS